jgi:hypothetical protein
MWYVFKIIIGSSGMATHYVGLGAHWKHTTVCILDGHGKRVKRLTIRGAWPKIADKLK